MKGSRKEKANALNHLPTYLGLAYEQLSLGPRLASGIKTHPIKIFEERIESNKDEESEVAKTIYLVKMQIMEHLESQHRRTRENIQLYTKATEDYKRLEEGVGTKEELDAFETLFGNHKSN